MWDWGRTWTWRFGRGLGNLLVWLGLLAPLICFRICGKLQWVFYISTRKHFRSKRKQCLVKHDMPGDKYLVFFFYETGDKYLVTNCIKTPITLVRGAIANENTGLCFFREFVLTIMSKIGKSPAAKNSYSTKIWMFSK